MALGKAHNLSVPYFLHISDRNKNIFFREEWRSSEIIYTKGLGEYLTFNTTINIQNPNQGVLKW